MFKLDDDLLRELGLAALPPAEKNKMLAHIYETLELRVGMKLAEQMSDAQLDEFEGFIDRNDEAGALKWLETNFPNYKDVVASELDKLKGEIKDQAPQIMEATMSQMNGEGAAPAAQPSLMPAPTMTDEPSATDVPMPADDATMTPQPQDDQSDAAKAA
ncbi:hypothetical protein A3F65_01630 [Candidatus Saccharibacteria bacterium RIFCSPHIGHO2_12_FULL_47_16b]|nr:MAG: hypothetical protein A3F65_01630 [Candidatus Saccharibacteria bacterium RIFCSPHIGHO2_12_FULL_47_16b]